MEASVIPFARSLLLCKQHIGYQNREVDLYGIFNVFRPQNGYPLEGLTFCAFTQLSNGLGKIPFHFDISYPLTNELVWTTDEKVLKFESRSQTVQLAMQFENCSFGRPGVYLIELFCKGEWLCDARLELR